MPTVLDIVSLVIPYASFSIRDEDNNEYLHISPVFEHETYAVDEIIKSKYADYKVIKIKVLTHCLVLYIDGTERKNQNQEDK